MQNCWSEAVSVRSNVVQLMSSFKILEKMNTEKFTNSADIHSANHQQSLRLVSNSVHFCHIYVFDLCELIFSCSCLWSVACVCIVTNEG